LAYAREVERALKKAGCDVGDRVRVEAAGGAYEGILLPRTGVGDARVIVLKLDNGYNIGVEWKGEGRVKLLEKGKPIEFRPAGEPGKGGGPPISILGCGGTIASRVEYRTGAVFPAFSPGDLFLSFPELRGMASFSGRKLFDLLSEDMTPAHWQAIAREVAKEIRGGAEGIVLMHGTDTMGYTAAALSFMLRSLPVPVVLVGSMRSSDRGSSDNAMNLVCSVVAAKSDCAEVGVCMHASLNDDYCFLHRGTKVRKLHTSRRDAFRSVNAGPLARVWYKEKKFEALADYSRRDGKRKLELDDRINPRVGLVWVHPGISPKFVERLADYYDGVVFAGTGLESALPTNPFGDKLAVSLVPALRSLIASGVAVVLAPQTLFGRINLNVYTTGRTLKALGAIGDGCDWLPETAFVKLAWVLGHTRELKKVEEMMLTNYAGEISGRLVV